jgi:hypothetical protein
MIVSSPTLNGNKVDSFGAFVMFVKKKIDEEQR